MTVTHLDRLYAALRTDGRHDGEPLAPKTVLNVHQILRTALGDAERRGLVERNVARLMDPACHGIAPEQLCWNESQLARFLETAMSHRLGTALWLAAMTGMRRGEVLGIRWNDVDLDARRLSVAPLSHVHRLPGPYQSNEDKDISSDGGSGPAHRQRARRMAGRPGSRAR